MDEDQFRHWLTNYQADDAEGAMLLERLLGGLSSLGFSFCRASVWLPTAHPELWGRQLVWSKGRPAVAVVRPHEVYDSSTFRSTPGEAVHVERRPLRYDLSKPAAELDFPMFHEIQADGGTDYLIIPFHTDHEREQPWLALATDAPSGFTEEQVQELLGIASHLAWKARVITAESSIGSLLRLYLGRRAGTRVEKGEFRRGTGSQIDALVWFCDLRGFTSLGDQLPATELVALLDCYFDLVSEVIDEAGGEILKFIGDAILAVFPLHDDGASVARRVLAAAHKAHERLAKNAATRSDGHELKIGIALHRGEVLYGNIGSRSRLDFTVIGSAVNEAARMESLCKELGDVLVSEEVARLAGEGVTQFLCERRLRGVSRPLRIHEPVLPHGDHT